MTIKCGIIELLEGNSPSISIEELLPTAEFNKKGLLSVTDKRKIPQSMGMVSKKNRLLKIAANVNNWTPTLIRIDAVVDGATPSSCLIGFQINGSGSIQSRKEGNLPSNYKIYRNSNFDIFIHNESGDRNVLMYLVSSQKCEDHGQIVDLSGYTEIVF